MFDILTYISIVSGLVPFICSILRFKALNSELRALFIYLSFTLIAETASYFLSKNHIPNYFVQNIYTFIECSTIAFIYHQNLNNRNARLFIKLLYLVFFLLSLYRFFINDGLNQADSALSTYESCLVIFLALFYFYNEMKELNVPRLTEHYFFWINSAFLLYFLGAFAFFLFNDYIERLPLSIYYLVYGIQLIVNICYNVLLSLGIWKIIQK